MSSTSDQTLVKLNDSDFGLKVLDVLKKYNYDSHNGSFTLKEKDCDKLYCSNNTLKKIYKSDLTDTIIFEEEWPQLVMNYCQCCSAVYCVDCQFYFCKNSECHYSVCKDCFTKYDSILGEDHVCGTHPNDGLDYLDYFG